MILRNPKEFEAAGLSIPERTTLDNTVEYHRWYKELEKWSTRLPGLHTPRALDGTGGTPPRPHQLRHVSIAAQRRHNFFSWSMGTGKTLASILLILSVYGEFMFNEIDYDRLNKAEPDRLKFMLNRARQVCTMRPGTIHIAAPRHVLNLVWMRELERCNLAQFAEVIRTESQLMNSKAPIFIYDVDFPKHQTDKGAHLRARKEGVRIKQNGTTYFQGHTMSKLIYKHRPPSLLIVDEIHKLREGTERTRCMLQVRRKAKRVLGLTGTPMDGWVRHASTLFGFIYGEQSYEFPFTTAHFSEKFTRKKLVSVDVATGEQTTAKERPVPGIDFMNIPSFLKATAHLAHRLNITDPEVKENVFYPETRDHVVHVEMNPEHKDEYRELYTWAREKKDELSGASLMIQRRSALGLINQLRLRSKVPTQGVSALTQELIRIVSECKAQGRKGLIGTTFIEESRMLHAALQAAGLKGVRLYADDEFATPKHLSTDRREDLVDEFCSSDEMDYLICNKELVAEGLNLSEFVNYTVNCSHSWRSNTEVQWLGRVVRPGPLAHGGVDNYVLINTGTIDVYVYDLVKAKIAANAAMIDLEFDGDSYGDSLPSAEIDTMELAKKLEIA